MEWLRSRIAEALAGSRPVSRKLLVALGVLVASVVFVISNLSTPVSEQKLISGAPAPDQTSDTAGDQPSVEINQALIYVHIIGEIASPGLYELEAGARVVDAVFAAGGLTSKADQSSVNLARALSDGEQVFIGEVGVSPSPTGEGGLQSNLVNLNRATAVELEQLPGVGPALAGRLVDWREANGGFKKKEDLLEVSGIGDKLYAGIKDLISL